MAQLDHRGDSRHFGYRLAITDGLGFGRVTLCAQNNDPRQHAQQRRAPPHCSPRMLIL
jgi:hypothetical protein